MKRILRLLALLVALGALITWAATGANRGWTKTSLVTHQTDPVTGIVYPVSTSKFLPGVDFLGAAAVAVVILTGTSFLFRSKKPANTTNATNN
jgi:hypothetical protein